MTDRQCIELLQWAAPRLGLRWAGFRNVRGQVCKRISRRARELGLDAAKYRALIEEDVDERERFDAFCRVTITRFYRDRAVFDALPSLLPRDGTPLRIWSAGCASGEEPYTVALMLRLGMGLESEGFSIDATDSDPVLLERAHRACYPAPTLRELPQAWRSTAFEAAPEDELCLRPDFREGVRFHQQDLRREQPSGPFHLILCRNLAFTYFDESLQEQVASRFLSQFAPGGLLVIGGHERLPPLAREHFHPAAASLPIFVAEEARQGI